MQNDVDCFFCFAEGTETLKTEQSSTLLITVIDEDNKQANERDGEPQKGTRTLSCFYFNDSDFTFI